MWLKNRDFLVSVMAIVCGALLFNEAMGMTYPSKSFPVAVSGFIIFMGVLLLACSLYKQRVYTTSFWPSIWTLAVIACAVIYVIAIHFVGFYVSSFICIQILSLITSTHKATGRTMVVTALASVVFLGLIWLVFSYFLHSTIPSGMLF